MATRSGNGRPSSRLAKENRSRVTERAAKGSLLTGCEQERRQGAPRPRQEKRRRGAGEHGNSPVYCPLCSLGNSYSGMAAQAPHEESPFDEEGKAHLQIGQGFVGAS